MWLIRDVRLIHDIQFIPTYLPLCSIPKPKQLGAGTQSREVAMESILALMDSGDQGSEV